MTDNMPTAEAVRAATAALNRANIHDDRLVADKTRIRVWADTMTVHGIVDTALACRAVDVYYAQPGAQTAKVGDIIAAYRRLRAEWGEREKAEDLRELTSGGFAGINATGEPVWDAYEAHDAVDRECPSCGALPNESCVNPINNQPRRIPCVSRLKGGAS